MKRNLFLVVCLMACAALWAQVTPNLWHEYTANPNAHPNIPNCSYAGYRYGDTPIPTEAAKTFNVKDYGAKGNNRADDTEAIRSAIAAAEEAGGGIVYLPNGEYICSGVLFINSSNVILRGNNREKTIIYFNKSLTDGYAPNYTMNGSSLDQRIWSWAGGMIWITPRSKNTYLKEMPDNLINTWLGGYDTYMAKKEEWNVTTELTAITSSEERGERSFTVASASGLSAGQYVAIHYANPADWSLMKFFTGDGRFANEYNWGSGTGWISPQNRPYVDWVVQIEKVEGNRVTLMQPLRVPLRQVWSPKLMGIGDLVMESGVENLTIELEKDYESQYDNSNWRNANHNREMGWNGIYMNNAVNCFVKDVTIYDAEMSAGTAASKNITFTGVRVYGKDQSRSTHHGFTCRRQSQDILFENFELRKYNQFDHGINVEDFSMGCVWHSGIVMKGCFDTHRLVPAECLRTNIKVDVGGGYGGAGEAGPQIGARFVHWNVELKSGTTNTITPAVTMPMGALVAIAGDRPSSSEASGCIVEASNMNIEQEDLYISQKQLRNNSVQETSLMTPWTVYDLTTRPLKIEAEAAMIRNVRDDNDSQAASGGLYLNSFHNASATAEYDFYAPESGKYTFSFSVTSEDHGENCLAVMDRGAEVGHITFNGIGRGGDNWRTIDAEVLLNKGKHTLQLVGLKGMTCLDYIEIKETATTSTTPFPVFATLPGEYNGFVNVEIVAAEGATIYYKIPGKVDNWTVYTQPIELTESATVITKAEQGGIFSIENTASYVVNPPVEVPCKIFAVDYSDQKGMSIQGITDNNDQLSVGQEGDWADYVIKAPVEGDYIVATRISIKTKGQVPSTGFEVMVNGTSVKKFEGLLDMGGNWDRFKIYPTKVHLKQGLNTIRLVSLGKRFTFDYINIFKNDPIALPGIIQNENYLPQSSNYGLSRNINRTVNGQQKSGQEVALNSGMTKLYYDVYVAEGGKQPITLCVSSKGGASVGRLVKDDTNETIATFSFNETAGNQGEQIVTTEGTLPAGTYTLRFEFQSGGEFYADYIQIGNSEDLITGIESINQNRCIKYDANQQNIVVKGFGKRAFSLYSFSGTVVMKGVCSDSSPINVNSLVNGCYVLKIAGGATVKILKF